MTARERKCGGTNAKGEPCAFPVVGDDGLCAAHRAGGEERMKRHEGSES